MQGGGRKEGDFHPQLGGGGAVGVSTRVSRWVRRGSDSSFERDLLLHTCVSLCG